jgi:xylulokinase
MKHVIAIDLGTTNIKAVVFDEHLSVVASAQKSCNTYRDLPGQAEQDPDESRSLRSSQVQKHK